MSKRPEAHRRTWLYSYWPSRVRFRANRIGPTYPTGRVRRRLGHPARGRKQRHWRAMAVASRVAETLHRRFLLWRSCNRYFEFSATWAPTHFPALRVSYQWLKGFLRPFWPWRALAWGASHGEFRQRRALSSVSFEASKILASRGLCAGILIAGRIGTHAGASVRATTFNPRCHGQRYLHGRL